MPTPPEVPFARVAIVGVGLIGGSIARALRHRAPTVRIVVVDRPEVVIQARAAGLVDEVAATVPDLVDVDLVVLATPIPAILEAITVLGALRSPAVVTDVGSTKRRIGAAAQAAGLQAFVGGHPMAGRERGGLGEAAADLFVGRRWFLVDEGSAATPGDRVAAFVRLLGAEPERVDATTHDRTMAYVSHLPQLVSTLLMADVGEAVGPRGLGWAGRGLEDLTRLAGSPADIWQGIFATNADFVAEAASHLATNLAALGSHLDDSRAVGEQFARAHQLRNGWLGPGGPAR
jgi:prephenate dehydrogenase